MPLTRSTRRHRLLRHLCACLLGLGAVSLFSLAAQAADGLAGAAGASAPADGRVADHYRLRELPRDAGIVSRRMNAHGTVVGHFADTQLPMRATAHGPIETLALTGPDFHSGTARGVSPAGDAVGYQLRGGLYWGDSTSRALKWPASGGVVDLASTLPSYPNMRSYALDINEAGQAVGYYDVDEDGNGWADFGQTVVWSADGTPEFLPNPPRGQAMLGSVINNLGHVGGSVQHRRTYRDVGFFWSPETGYRQFGLVWAVRDMNDRDEVVGDGSYEGYGHPFYWNPSMGKHVQKLPLFKGYRRCTATAISRDSLIVGHCDAAGVPGRLGQTIAVAWEHQPDGAWQVTELASRFKRRVFDARTWVSDIDSQGRMLFSMEWHEKWWSHDASGVAVPAPPEEAR
ncbi:hypothetical protein [Ideonella sp.]|uniref:hypothetical protein n=1 Tax=Ideonella sp. TaxID=1929293 RepID=UPI0035B1667D